MVCRLWRSAGDAELPVLVAPGWAVLPWAGMWGDEAQCGDHMVATVRGCIWHPAGNWCRSSMVGLGPMKSSAQL